MIAEFAWTHGSAAWRLLLLLLLLNPTQRNPLEATINSSPHVPPWLVSGAKPSSHLLLPQLCPQVVPLWKSRLTLSVDLCVLLTYKSKKIIPFTSVPGAYNNPPLLYASESNGSCTRPPKSSVFYQYCVLFYRSEHRSFVPDGLMHTVNKDQ